MKLLAAPALLFGLLAGTASAGGKPYSVTLKPVNNEPWIRLHFTVENNFTVVTRTFGPTENKAEARLHQAHLRLTAS